VGVRPRDLQAAAMARRRGTAGGDAGSAVVAGEKGEIRLRSRLGVEMATGRNPSGSAVPYPHLPTLTPTR
jgi:hypothetical protein